VVRTNIAATEIRKVAVADLLACEGQARFVILMDHSLRLFSRVLRVLAIALKRLLWRPLLFGVLQRTNVQTFDGFSTHRAGAAVISLTRQCWCMPM
jgi:hypothetical protein